MTTIDEIPGMLQKNGLQEIAAEFELMQQVSFVLAVGAVIAGTTAHFAGAIYVHVRRQIDAIAVDECDNMRKLADEIREIDPEARRNPVPEMCADMGNRSE